jgi:hypothetical protein
MCTYSIILDGALLPPSCMPYAVAPWTTSTPTTCLGSFLEVFRRSALYLRQCQRWLLHNTQPVSHRRMRFAMVIIVYTNGFEI